MIDVAEVREKIASGNGVVYYVWKVGYDWSVRFGVLTEYYTDAAMLELYELADIRLIDGVPVKEFQTPTRWKKLPKDWGYGTPLFHITESRFTHDPDSYNITKPDDILRAIKDGGLVKVKDVDHAGFDVDIDSKQGWRIVRKYDGYSKPSYITAAYHNLYRTYEEANKVVDEHVAEFERQKNLSDYEWSVEKIDETLNRWEKCYSITPEKKDKYREWILSLGKIEDVEARICQGRIQWKYWKNKRWSDIAL